MSDLSSILSNLQLKEDLFKSVTYITTGDLNEKVIFFLLFFPHNISNTNKKKHILHFFLENLILNSNLLFNQYLFFRFPMFLKKAEPHTPNTLF